MKISTEVGDSIPPNTKHAVSVCLPTWEATVGYEEGESWVVEKMTTGYPRFFIHKSIQRLCNVLKEKYAKQDETCLVFPSYEVAKRCREFCKVKNKDTLRNKIRILQLATSKPLNKEEESWRRECKIAVVFAKSELYPLLKQYWQHSGEIISSRLAEYVLDELFEVENKDGKMVAKQGEEFVERRFGRSLDFSYANRAKLLIKRRIARKVVDVEEDDEQPTQTNDANSVNHNSLTRVNVIHEEQDGTSTFDHTADSSAEDIVRVQFLGADDDDDDGNFVDMDQNSTIPAEPFDEVEFEQINISPPSPERERTDPISLTDVIESQNVSSSIHLNPERDVFLFPSGMASIFTAHRLLLELDSKRVKRNNVNTSANTPIGYGGAYKKTVMFGFPYTDTLSILRKFNHTHFLGQGDSQAMNELKEILHGGEQILAVFIESPSNPLLKMGDLVELKRLSDLYGFYIVIDETVGGFLNIDVLPYADVVCSSLTKIFSGDSNVMAGSIVLNPRSRLYEFATTMLHLTEKWYEDLLWCEDAICLERNSRDFISRSILVNENTESLLEKVILPQQGEGKLFKKVFYPKYTNAETKKNYDQVKAKTAGSGYGGLFSVTFYNIEQAKMFFNSLNLCKGPSLGTNFTLACPYTVLAHYQEMEEVAKFGLEDNLVRVSVGLESKQHLEKVFQTAIDAALTVQ
ncbi:cystathionine gamma-synthase [Kluyveromyces lactis]|uniref:cystathionine gamma-synthase n=1 Tax=Kluyveromyces lactis (strain ATCC 8585 / CBS 2359 / DSM 70799 / NBRC 1267 / NRRL Y-1140 / WM37) TaxID=284590 RepID=Q6CWG2_KLULA|nr:uncharacterized protein KLLA0_B04378g [Kluyveromyces lactis]CAH02120.1 KLLA0B04378p [Kluyveromyces lactis]|eukprot:XP_451727.1 uncharacterized protein KLLA0_B04378g [Kluyveromyces lactis]